MTFNEYQEFAKSTAVYPDQGENLIYPTLGLAGEVGEVADKVGKMIRDRMPLNDALRLELMKEAGDVLWFLSQLAHELGYDFETLATMNIEKLRSRKERGVVHGSGDNR